MLWRGVVADEVLRVANCSGFLGDRLDAAREMVEGGPIDVLTGDYLAELTMLILWRSRAKDPSRGYARTFLDQMEQVLGSVLDRGIKVVTNAGGLNPAGLAERLHRLAEELGVSPAVAYLEGDDLVDRIDELRGAGHDLAHLDTGEPLGERRPVTANAYLGAWGIVEALSSGADIVVCPRVTDASLVVGPAAWYFGWARDDWDRLGGAVAVGHVLECGAQATGGNYAFFEEVPGLTHPGFPLAEVEADGSAVITKHEGTGGLVSVGTVTAQLLYEIGPPAYVNPDVVAHFETIALEQVGPNRVRLSGVRGAPPPDRLKAALNLFGGFRNDMTFVLTGLDVEAKADLVEASLREHLDLDAIGEVEFHLRRTDVPDAESQEAASAQLDVVVKDLDADKIGRAFSNVGIELALANYPGFHVTAPPADARPFGVWWPALVPKGEIHEEVVLPSGERVTVAQTDGVTAGVVEVPAAAELPPPPEVPPVPAGPTRRVPIGRVVGARSGDKGGNANVGVWARSPEGYAWLVDHLTVERFKELVPEAEPLEVQRYELPNLWALNLVVVGILGEGVSSSTRRDPQAKGLGEYLRSRYTDVPGSLLS